MNMSRGNFLNLEYKFRVFAVIGKGVFQRGDLSVIKSLERDFQTRLD